MSFLDVTSLGCLRGGRHVFQALTITLEPGAAILLTGPNGSGKSSLLRMIAGLLPPLSGDIRVRGLNPYQDGPAESLYIGHTNPVKQSLTVHETLCFWAGLAAEPQAARAAIPDALTRLDLTELKQTRGSILSSGQRRRLSLARLIVCPKPLWLLDEPTIGLDARSIHQLEQLVSEHRARGGAVILSTHSPVSLPERQVLDMDDYQPGGQPYRQGPET